MGGGLALLLGMHLRKDEFRVDMYKRFMGVMTNCPAIVGEGIYRLSLLSLLLSLLSPLIAFPCFRCLLSCFLVGLRACFNAGHVACLLAAAAARCYWWWSWWVGMVVLAVALAVMGRVWGVMANCPHVTVGEIVLWF